MGVNVYCTLTMHKYSKRKGPESNIGALAAFINVQSFNVVVVVDVVRYEECGLENVEDVLRRGG